MRIGIDVVSVSRVADVFGRHDDFWERIFAPGEVAYCRGKRAWAQHLAARFAAKEATFKAMGCGIQPGICWTDVEVRREASGEPRLCLSGRLLALAEGLGVREALVSLSHTDDWAVAQVILLTGAEASQPGRQFEGEE